MPVPLPFLNGADRLTRNRIFSLIPERIQRNARCGVTLSVHSDSDGSSVYFSSKMILVIVITCSVSGISVVSKCCFRFGNEIPPLIIQCCTKVCMSKHKFVLFLFLIVKNVEQFSWVGSTVSNFFEQYLWPNVIKNDIAERTHSYYYCYCQNISDV